MNGILERGVDPSGPEFYVDTDNGTFTVAVISPAEIGLLRTWIGRQVRFSPKTMGTRTDADSGKIEAVVFATDVWRIDLSN